MKIKKFNELNEGVITGVISFIIIGYLLSKFIYSILKKRGNRLDLELNSKMAAELIKKLEEIGKISLIELPDRYYGRNNDIDIRLLKNEKMLILSGTKGDSKIKLTDDEYDRLLKLITIE